VNSEVPFTLLRLNEPLKRFWKHYFKLKIGQTKYMFFSQGSATILTLGGSNIITMS